MKVCSTPDYYDAIKIEAHIIKVGLAFIRRGRKTKWRRKFELADKQERLRMLVERTHRGSAGKNPTYLQRRKKKHKPTGKCEVCGSVANCRHHITPLINGGTNQPDNLINICNICHCQVHTWMDVPTPEYIKEMDSAFRGTI